MEFLPAITIEQERALIRTGTKNALDKLALHTLAEAVTYTRHISRGQFEQTELISLCWAALRQAAKNYRRRKSGGIRFFAFAKQHLRGALNAEYRSRKIVRNSETVSLDNEFEEGYIKESRGDDAMFVGGQVEPDFSNIETQEFLAGLRPAIFSQLNDRERAILILRYEAGFSFTEIGERIGFSRQSIQKTHFKALQKLRSVLQEKRTQLL